ALSQAGPARVREQMDAIAKGITSAYGATYTLEYEEGAAVTYHGPQLTQATRPALAAVVGDANVVVPAPQMGAEDFSYFQKEVPGVYYFLGVRNEAKKITAMIHTEYFDIDEDAMQIGVRSMATVVMDYLARAGKDGSSSK